MPAPKLIFLDIDGTLTTPGSNTPPDSALLAIQKAQEKGNLVFLCTGRNLAMLRPLLSYGFDGVVASAGGYVLFGDNVLYDCPMTMDQTVLALNLLKKGGVFRTIEALDATFGDSGLSEFLGAEGDSEGNSELERWRRALAEDLGIQPMEAYDGRPIYKVVYMCLHEDQLREAKAKMGNDYDFVQQTLSDHAGCINGEMINRSYSKGTGIEKICGHLELSLQDTYGFGDSANDAAMIDVVGTSICMGNGSDDLKTKCDLVCPPVDEDGLYKAFEKLELF